MVARESAIRRPTFAGLSSLGTRGSEDALADAYSPASAGPFLVLQAEQGADEPSEYVDAHLKQGLSDGLKNSPPLRALLRVQEVSSLSNGPPQPVRGVPPGDSAGRPNPRIG
jgi:hypothetical protein